MEQTNAATPNKKLPIPSIFDQPKDQCGGTDVDVTDSTKSNDVTPPSTLLTKKKLPIPSIYGQSKPPPKNLGDVATNADIPIGTETAVPHYDTERAKSNEENINESENIVVDISSDSDSDSAK